MNPFKLTTIQFAPAFGNVNETISHLEPLLAQAKGADLVVLPELANSGYNFKDFEEAYAFSEIPEKSTFIDFLIAQSEKHGFSVVTGFNERSGNQIYNSSLLLNNSGVIGKYRKIQLFMNEKDYFQPGDQKPQIYDLNGVKIGMLICFDWMFPELWNGLAQKGADVICHPSNLVLPGKAQKAIPVWAMINRVFVATANRIGTERNLTFTGLSLIASPQGEVLAQGSQAEAQVLGAECEIGLARDKMITPKNHVFQDRRPELYQ
jgi:predicted amidohydrolase